jgi:opacity protein-like surface antigen
MKKYLFIMMGLLSGMQAKAQYNSITLSGGYVFTNIEDTETSASGFRINGLYEYHPIVGKVVHGFSVGYVNVSTDVEEVSGGQPIVSTYTISTWPFYYAPKLLIGEGSLQGFVKGALGMQFSNLKIELPGSEFKSNDAGLYAGLGAGVQKEISDKISINLEYEWAYQSNSYYRDGFINSVMLGVGFKLNK